MKRLGARPRNLEEEARCGHHWIIESPNGPTSWGVCKYCAAELEFINCFPDVRSKEDRSASDELSASTGFKSDEKSEVGSCHCGATTGQECRENDMGKKTNQTAGMLTVREASQLLRVHSNTLRRWSAHGIVKTYRLGPSSQRRFRAGDIATLIKKRKQAIKHEAEVMVKCL